MPLHLAKMFSTFLLIATVLASSTNPFTIPQIIGGRPEPVSSELSASQAEWINKLETQESSGSTTIKVLDTNNKYSYSCLQFQAETFLTQGKLYGLIATSTKEAEPLIYNCELQKEIAHKMLLDGKEYHWKNSVAKLKLGKYPQN